MPHRTSPWRREGAELFVPDGAAPDEALERTTHLGVGAHQDDLEIMAYHGVLACFGQSEQWFTGAVVTDGRGSPRADAYADVSDAAMSEVRKAEQKKAAAIGEYAAVVLMNHPSASVKDAANAEIAADLDALLAATLPQFVYTHNLADKHDSHVAVTLRVLAAIRRMKPSARPRKVIGCEVWRDLDWLNDADKVAMPVDDPSPLADALLGSFESQIGGGKRYDLATRGRRLANATFFDGSATDEHQAVIWGLDLTPLTEDDAPDPFDYLERFVARFTEDLRSRIARLK